MFRRSAVSLFSSNLVQGTINLIFIFTDPLVHIFFFLSIFYSLVAERTIKKINLIVQYYRLVFSVSLVVNGNEKEKEKKYVQLHQ